MKHVTCHGFVVCNVQQACRYQRNPSFQTTMCFPYLDLYMNDIKLGTLLHIHKENVNQNLSVTAVVYEMVLSPQLTT